MACGDAEQAADEHAGVAAAAGHQVEQPLRGERDDLDLAGRPCGRQRTGIVAQRRPAEELPGSDGLDDRRPLVHGGAEHDLAAHDGHDLRGRRVLLEKRVPILEYLPRGSRREDLELSVRDPFE